MVEKKSSLNLDHVQYINIMHNTCTIYNATSIMAVTRECAYPELFDHQAAWFPVELITIDSVFVYKHNMIELMVLQLEWTFLFY